MLKEPIADLADKNVALVAMGQSQIDFHLSQVHSVSFDEIWAVNAMIGVLPEIDRAFILDPMSRFFDTEDAGSMTFMMRKHLPQVDYPLYTCELDDRVPYAEEFPLTSLVADLKCSYFNNTVAYAMAFALWNKIGSLTVFGVDFTYKTNMHYAESGKACCEFWLAKCMENDIEVSIAPRSNLLETNVDIKEKLYGYHRLEDPVVTYLKEGTTNKPQMIDRNDLPPEPEEY
jgi:hypothetical protein